MLLVSDTLSRFQANQFLPFNILFNAAYTTEKQHISILIFHLTRLVLEPMLYHTWGKHTIRYTINAIVTLYDTISSLFKGVPYTTGR